MDASATQLGAVIAQDNRPIAFFSRKLSKMQQKYSVTEIELLAIVETPKEFKGLLWGQDIKVYTDHKNLTIDALGLTLKEYAQAEGVSAKLGAALESAIDLSRGSRVSETAEYCEKVPRTPARPQVDLVLGGNGTGTCLMHADT